MDPKKYQPDYSFSNYQANKPKYPLPAPELDIELANIAEAIGTGVDAIKDIRRSDGALKNGIVTSDSLSPGLLMGLEKPTAWETDVEYNVLNTVYVGVGNDVTQGIYRAKVSHTSSVFADDLDAGYWDLIFDLSLAGGVMQKLVYDPQDIQDDAFDRANHTGPIPDGLVTLDTLDETLTQRTWKVYDTVTGAGGLLESTEPARGAGAIWVAQGFRYSEAESGATVFTRPSNLTGYHLITAGGVKLKALRELSGVGAFVDIQFGVTRDGVTDDATALNLLAQQRGLLSLTGGIARTASTVSFDGTTTIIGAGQGFSIIQPDASVLVGLQFGETERYFGGASHFTVQRAAYDGATENINILLRDMSDFLWSAVESRFAKYPMRIKPKVNGRIAYGKFERCSYVGGYHNIDFDGTDYFYANELTFEVCRGFATANTRKHVNQIIGNHVRYLEFSAEGTPLEHMFYLNNTHSCVIFSPRCEGAPGVAKIELGANALRCSIFAWDLYTTVVDGGPNNLVQTAQGGMSYSTAINGATTNLFKNESATDAINTIFRSNRDNDTSWAFQLLRGNDGLFRGGMTTAGLLDARVVRTSQSGWNGGPLRLGTFYLWVDGGGRLKIKNGAPVSDGDGTIVGTQS